MPKEPLNSKRGLKFELLQHLASNGCRSRRHAKPVLDFSTMVAVDPVPLCALCGEPITGLAMSMKCQDWTEHYHATSGPYGPEGPSCAMRVAEIVYRLSARERRAVRPV